MEALQLGVPGHKFASIFVMLDGNRVIDVIIRSNRRGQAANLRTVLSIFDAVKKANFELPIYARLKGYNVQNTTDMWVDALVSNSTPGRPLGMFTLDEYLVTGYLMVLDDGRWEIVMSDLYCSQQLDNRGSEIVVITDGDTRGYAHVYVKSSEDGISIKTSKVPARCYNDAFVVDIPYTYERRLHLNMKCGFNMMKVDMRNKGKSYTNTRNCRYVDIRENLCKN